MTEVKNGRGRVGKDIPKWVNESGGDLGENEVDETWIEVQWMFSIYKSDEHRRTRKQTWI